MHYGSQLLPFLEILPILEDQDAVWAIKPETTEESDGESLMDEEDYIKPYSDKPDPPSVPSSSPSDTHAAVHKHTGERKASLPLERTLGLVSNGPTELLDPASTKQQLKELHRIANEVMAIDASEIAEEITRVEAKYFLDITVSIDIMFQKLSDYRVYRIVIGCILFSRSKEGQMILLRPSTRLPIILETGM